MIRSPWGRLLAGAASLLLLVGCGGGSGDVAVGDTGVRASRLPPVPAGAECPESGSADLSGHTSALGTAELPCLRPGPSVAVASVGGDRPVLVNLWASWCPPCQREMPRLQRTYAVAGRQVLFIGVDTRDTTASARSFLAAVRVTYPQVVDTDGKVARHVGTVGLPVTLLLDTSGRVAYRRLGEMRPNDIVGALARVGVTVTTQQLADR